MGGLRWIISVRVLWIYLFGWRIVMGNTPHEYTAVAGGRVALPCNITAPAGDDSVTLALWYKGDVKVPIYTLDARAGPLERARHFPSSRLGRRFHFDVRVRKPALAIEPVKAEDEGQYRCRVEYKRYRTLSYTYELRVVVPPREVTILDERGQRIEETVGPVDEGSNVTLICEAEGGTPAPAVTWWRDSVLLDDSFRLTTQGAVRNELRLASLSRRDLLTALTCQAANNNLTVPAAASVTLDLNLRPLNVQISGDLPHLSAGRPVSLDCESAGSRPRAQLSWFRGGQPVQSGSEVVSDNGNLTLSSYSFVPAAEDHGKKVSCVAENPSLPGSRIEAQRTLIVHYLPELRLALGASIRHTAIKEGSDVYFDCNIRAHPWVQDVWWRFEGRTLASNLSAGVLVSNQSLVLQRVQRGHRGRYQCVAINAEGEGSSEEVRLDVQFTPVCKSKPGQVFGVSKHETLNVTCNLDADPTDVTFHWALNNTVESIAVKDFTSERTTSTAFYLPRNIQGYGALLCWGSNAMGRQKEPCVFRVVPVGPPESMRECKVTNHTVDSLLVRCEPGYDNGLPQTFHLEVYSSSNERLKGNVTSSEDGQPSFLVQELLTGTSFVLVLYAANAKGRSSSVALVASTLRPAERHTAGEEELSLSPMLGILIGIVVAIVVLFVAVALIVRRRTRDKHKDSDDPKQEKCEIPLQNYKEESIDSTIESPDVIPADSQVYGPEAKALECTRRMNEEMYKLLQQRRDSYDAPHLHRHRSDEVGCEELPYEPMVSVRGGYPPPTEYADVYRTHGLRHQGLPLPVSDALDKRAPELPLINNVQQNTRECIRGDHIVATTPL